MKSLFSLDSGVTRILNRIFDMVALNVLFLLCCLPLVTIGAAQSGLMNAVRVMQDKEDDGSVFMAFFRGILNGFWRITVVWTVLLVLIIAMMYILLGAIWYEMAWQQGVVVTATLALGVCMLFQSMAAAFHSRFSCTVMQLVRNCWLMIIAYFLPALVMTLLIWAPVIAFMLDLGFFMQVTPVLLLIYYCAAFYVSAILMRRPFRTVEEQLSKEPGEEE